MLILKVTISETERASKNGTAGGCTVDGKEEIPYLSLLPDTMFLSFPKHRKSAEFITWHILSRKNHLLQFSSTFSTYWRDLLVDGLVAHRLSRQPK
jgi:hypothetical protein